MKKLLLICSVFVSAYSISQTASEVGETFLNKMLRSQYDSCRSYFDSSVVEKINPDMMQQMWGRIQSFVGEFKSYSNVREEKADTLDIVLITCVFEKTKLDLKLSLNQRKKLVGIFFVPVKSNAVYNVPEYYQVDKLYETKVPLKTGEFTMPGTFCIPNYTENPPVVIFVAGSGPNDKDETIGPNKILRDLALGLGSNGIASYRYDKRTLAEPGKLSQMVDKVGINEEVIDDVISAIALVRANEITKASKIFIVGHSLGAMCAPLIAKKSIDVAGIVMMAGPARGLEDVLIDQFNYLAKLDSVVDDDEKKQLTEIEKQIKTVKNAKLLKAAKAEELPLGMPSFYWQSLKNYNQVKVAKELKQPILVLKGERDYQVPMSEFAIWKKEIGSNSKNKFISYPNSNHLFLKGEGKSTPAEYSVSSNVEEQVIKDLAAWIKSIQ